MKSCAPMKTMPTKRARRRTPGSDSPVCETQIRWTAKEDAALKRVATGQSWDFIAGGLPGRTAAQCRERWRTRHTSKRWTVEEDEAIDLLQRLWGNRWSKIAGELEGRSDNDVKNRWNCRTRSRDRRARRMAAYREEMKSAGMILAEGDGRNEGAKASSGASDSEVLAEGESSDENDDGGAAIRAKRDLAAEDAASAPAKKLKQAARCGESPHCVHSDERKDPDDPEIANEVSFDVDISPSSSPKLPARGVSASPENMDSGAESLIGEGHGKIVEDPKVDGANNMSGNVPSNEAAAAFDPDSIEQSPARDTSASSEEEGVDDSKVSAAVDLDGVPSDDDVTHQPRRPVKLDESPPSVFSNEKKGLDDQDIIQQVKLEPDISSVYDPEPPAKDASASPHHKKGAEDPKDGDAYDLDTIDPFHPYDPEEAPVRASPAASAEEDANDPMANAASSTTDLGNIVSLGGNAMHKSTTQNDRNCQTHILVPGALGGLQDFARNITGAWLGQASEIVQNFEVLTRGPPEQEMIPDGKPAIDGDPPGSVDWIAQMAATIESKFTEQKQSHELQNRTLAASLEKMRQEKEEQRQENKRLADELSGEIEKNAAKGAQIGCLNQELERLKKEVIAKKETNEKNEACISNMQDLILKLQANVNERDANMKSSSEELAREKKAFAEKIDRMKSTMAKQTNSFDSAGKSQHAIHECLEDELRRTEDKLRTQQRSNDRQKQRTRELEAEMETMAEEYGAETERLKAQNSRLASAHEEEVRALNEELRALRSLLS